MFNRIAIVNRGEAAMRLIHAVRDLNAEAVQADPIRTVALHTDGEKHAMFVREADEAFNLGPAANRPYLDLALLERALLETGADAAWVGWGFVAEDPAFAELCERIGVTFIGPSPSAMRTLGDKIGSKLIAEEVGVPVAPWSGGGVDTLAEATEAAARIGYPLMLKATAGGGGRGIRRVDSDADLADAYQRTRDEAERAFGSGVVFLERLVTGARHVEVQVIADGQGTAWAIGVRDCSIQRRNQKVIEESASPVLSPEQADEVKAAAERLALAVDYSGAGTVEFLYHPAEKFFAFLEVNTRLQVEHPITEVATRTDLVKLQIHVAAGGRLEGERPLEMGHAVEARLNAEDPDRDFAPSPGHISFLDFPSGPGIRVDTGVAEGDEIPADFDSMIAKIIAFGADRDEALARLRRAMRETSVIIDGGSTNKSFVLDLLEQPEVISGAADTGWIDRVRAEGGLVTHEHSGIALLVAGIGAYLDEEAVERARLLETAHGGRPQVQHEVGRPVDLKLRGATYRVTVFRIGPHRYRASIEEPDGAHSSHDVQVEATGEHTSRITLAGRTHRLLTATHGPIQTIEVDGVNHRVSRDEGGVLRSPAPALVVATPAGVGDEVAAGAPVLVLESMKMETVIPAPFAGRVKELLVAPGSQIETGAPMVRLEPTGDEESAPAEAVDSVPLDLPQASRTDSPAERAARAGGDLVAMLLGYDVDPADQHRSLTDYLAARDDLVAAGGEPLADEIDVLSVFADFAELGRNRPVESEASLENRVHSPREHFHTFLQSLDPERGGLPPDFVTRLDRVLAHYGVDAASRTPDLEAAVFRIFLAQQRSQPEVAMVSAVLQRWLAEAVPAPPLDARASAMLRRLVRATQLRFPVVGDLARAVRFRWFEQPLADAERASILAGVLPEVQALDDVPPGPDRSARLDALADIPERIVGVLGDRLREGVRTSEPMLSVLVRRHYRDNDLVDMDEFVAADRAVATARYRIDGTPTYLISTLATMGDLTPAGEFAAAMGSLIAGRQSGDEAVLDLYLDGASLPADTDARVETIGAALGALPFTRDLRRIAVGIVGPPQESVGYVTYRPNPDGGLDEDRPVRDVHPMVGRRLDLWRLRDFDLERLDAPDDVLLLRATARDNAADQRLVALAQVRQLVLTRDEDGNVSGIPHIERAIAHCMDAIRRARTSLGTREARLDMNYVWLHVWPPVDAAPEQLTAMPARVAPLTAGAGVEEVRISGRLATPMGVSDPMVARFSAQPGAGVSVSMEPPATERLKPLDDYAEKVMRARRRGLLYPYELVSMISGAQGSVTEYDLDDSGALAPVERPYGQNSAGIICGVVTTPTRSHPEGVSRVLLCGDPLKSLGAVAEAECARIIAALDLAEELKLPVEWFALSAGARISMDSGTENMDWVARALKRIIEFTQDGGEINVVVAGINVGAQPYWNAEATMLMHTRGILVMTPDSAMVLTGKQSLDFSGGVSAEDNFGIGGYDRVMGPNGQAQYWAPDLAGAFGILLAHYEYSYVAPGESGPRPLESNDPVDRDVSDYPHTMVGSEFATVGEVFSLEKNPDRKKPFDIRSVMRAVADQDHPTLERWAGMADAETAVVLDAHLGGRPVTLLGIESHSVPRRGFPPTDGPDTYTAGTLFPNSSKKAARAINAASGNRPLVVLANLSGFDGSPESMRRLQLEYGAEIGRAIVNFDGPIVFVVISRYHGGAFVVFSKTLNDRMRVLALEGSHASVIGGAPAAAVVFARDVDARTASDPRVTDLVTRMNEAHGSLRAELATELTEVRTAVRAEMLGKVASEFDAVHNVYRAVEVGSVDEVIATAKLRPKIAAALESL